MSLYHAIKHIYPELNDDDFVLYDDGSGPIIYNWSSIEERPTDEELNAARKIVELKSAQMQKDEELNQACQDSILAGFTHVINGQTYWFSYDYEAQGNFRDAKEILSDGVVLAVPWTVRIGGKDGEYSRIEINLEQIKELALVIMEHKLNNISKYRDFLLPIVTGAETPEEVQEVKWT